MVKICIVGARTDDLVAALGDRGFRATTVAFEKFESSYPMGSAGPDAFIVDIRDQDRLPRHIAQIRRLFPTSGLVIVARTVDPTNLLEAMRTGVNEWVADPLNFDELAAALHRVARPIARAPIGKSIAVLGAKGGVGTTTVAVNLAAALHKRSKASTLLIDLHLAHGDAAIFLGVEPRYSIVDALENVHRLDEAYLKGLVASAKCGVDLLASSNSLLAHAYDPARIRAVLEFAVTAYTHVVLDCPRSDASMLEAINAASQVLVLANQELPTLRGAGRLLTALRQHCGSERVKLAIARLDAKAEIGQSDVERVLATAVKFTFPNDYQSAVTAITRGEPVAVHGNGRLAASFDQVARDLSGQSSSENKKDLARAGLFGRLAWR